MKRRSRFGEFTGHDRAKYALNTSIDWKSALPKLSRAVSGSFCFYGPPGTGKTALAHEIARRLKRPLMIRRGSDFLSKYIGETESRLAATFKEAAQSKSVLLIDEVDGMLFDRKEASKSWELTQVNEFLCLMENFEGLFICSTNAFQWLDPASLRRFSLKCEFSPLKPGQAGRLFDEWCKQSAKAKKDPKKDEARATVERLNKLTPGDYVAAVNRLHLFSEVWSAEDLARQLAEECAAKGGARGVIGFV